VYAMALISYLQNYILDEALEYREDPNQSSTGISINERG